MSRNAPVRRCQGVRALAAPPRRVSPAAREGPVVVPAGLYEGTVLCCPHPHPEGPLNGGGRPARGCNSVACSTAQPAAGAPPPQPVSTDFDSDYGGGAAAGDEDEF